VVHRISLQLLKEKSFMRNMEHRTCCKLVTKLLAIRPTSPQQVRDLLRGSCQLVTDLLTWVDLGGHLPKMPGVTLCPAELSFYSCKWCKPISRFERALPPKMPHCVKCSQKQRNTQNGPQNAPKYAIRKISGEGAPSQYSSLNGEGDTPPHNPPP